MKWHFIIYTSDGKYQINLTKSAVKENPKLLRSNVKRIIGIIVGLLKNRVSVDSSSASKGTRIKNLSKNNMYHGQDPDLYYFIFRMYQ